MIEIERKFRVLMDPAEWDEVAFTPLAAWDVRQGYVTSPGADPEVRVRRSLEVKVESASDVEPIAELDASGNETVLRWFAIKSTIAASASGLSRHEVEVPIDESHFAEAWKICEPRHLRKIRTEYMVDLPVGGHRVLTVDSFRGRLEGLVLAEIEFGNWDSSKEFEAPGFLGEEVTHDLRYRNADLASGGPPPE